MKLMRLCPNPKSLTRSYVDCLSVGERVASGKQSLLISSAFNLFRLTRLEKFTCLITMFTRVELTADYFT